MYNKKQVVNPSYKYLQSSVAIFYLITYLFLHPLICVIDFFEEYEKHARRKVHNTCVKSMMKLRKLPRKVFV